MKAKPKQKKKITVSDVERVITLMENVIDSNDKAVKAYSELYDFLEKTNKKFEKKINRKLKSKKK